MHQLKEELPVMMEDGGLSLRLTGRGDTAVTFMQMPAGWTSRPRSRACRKICASGPSNSAIVVVDLRTGRVRRALEGHPSLQPEEDASLVIEERPLRTGNPQGELEESKIGLDPIVIDPYNEWVYYGSLHGTSVFRVRATDVLDESLSKDELGQRVERYGEKAISDGISIDLAGNVYVTDLENNAIGVTKPDGSYNILARDDEHCIWPDGMSYGPDGYFYVTVSQLHRSAPLNAGEEISRPSFEVLRFRPLAPSVVGR